MTGRRARDLPGWPDADGGCQGWGAPSSASPRGLGPGDARPPPWRVQSLRAELGELPPPRFVKRSPKCLRIAPLRPAGSAMAIKSLSSDSFRPLSCSLSHKSRRACLTRRSTGARGATVNRRRAPPRPGAAGPRPRSRARRLRTAARRRGRAGGSEDTGRAPKALRSPAWLGSWRRVRENCGARSSVAVARGHVPHLAPRGLRGAERAPGGGAAPWAVRGRPSSRRGRRRWGRCHPQGPPSAGAGVPRGQALPSRSELRALSSLYAPVLRRLRRERARAARLTPPHEVHPFRYVWFSFNYFS